MPSYPALVIPVAREVPPVQIQVFTTSTIRDRVFERNQDVPGIRAVDLRFCELLDDELRQTHLWVEVDKSDPDASRMLSDYITEKIERIRIELEVDVTHALAGGESIDRSEMIWTTHFVISDAIFSVGINGYRKIVLSPLKSGHLDGASFHGLMDKCAKQLFEASAALARL